MSGVSGGGNSCTLVISNFGDQLYFSSLQITFSKRKRQRPSRGVSGRGLVAVGNQASKFTFVSLIKTIVGDRQVKTEIGNRQWAIGNTPYALGNNRQYMEYRVVPSDKRWQSRAVGSLAIANSV